MKAHRSKKLGLKLGLVVAAGLLLSLSPATAWAECAGGSNSVNGVVNGVLTETIERVSIVSDPESPTGLAREATAKEVGILTGGCGTLAFLEGRVKVQPAGSTVQILTEPQRLTGLPDLGTGPITGEVKFYPEGSGSGVLKGTLTGILDFSPTNEGPTRPSDVNCGTPTVPLPCPFVYAFGTWTIPSLNLAGWFGGVALVPFECGADTGWCYLNVNNVLGTGTPIVPLTQDETHPAPSAKFVITLMQ